MAACASQAVLAAANTCNFPTQRFFNNRYQCVSKLRTSSVFTIKASSEEAECNVEECAPDKEVIIFLPSFLVAFSTLFALFGGKENMAEKIGNSK